MRRAFGIGFRCLTLRGTLISLSGVVAYPLSGSVEPSSLPFSIPFSRDGSFLVLEVGEQYAEADGPPVVTRWQPPRLFWNWCNDDGTAADIQTCEAIEDEAGSVDAGLCGDAL